MNITEWNINLEDMMDAKVHFGHRFRNPKMALYSKRKGQIHIIDLNQTARLLVEACDFLESASKKGKNFLLVGTQYQAADLVEKAAKKSRCHYVNQKWLGGMLTNWYTIEKRLQRFEELEKKKIAGVLNKLPKKEAANLKRELYQLRSRLNGIRYMTSLPDIVIVIDQKQELTAVKECIKLGIPTICLVDTDCDPDLTDIPIPANNDARSSIQFVLDKLTLAIKKGLDSRAKSL